MPAPKYLAPTEEARTYTGICRCKANKFTLELPQLTGTIKCTCSICTKFDLFSWFGKEDQVKFERRGPQIEYSFGKKKITYHMCAICGNAMYGTMPGSGMCAVNERLLQDVDLWKLSVDKVFEGGKLDPQYEVPAYAGPSFTDGDNAASDTKIYHGSCHCGAVTLALRSKPLGKVSINECNCSFCWKDGRVHVYPSSEDVHLSGAEHVTMYDAGPPGTALFCKHCGAPMLVVDPKEAPKDKNGRVIEGAKEKLGYEWDVGAVNIRVLHGVEPEELPNVNKYDGRANDPQFVAN